MVACLVELMTTMYDAVDVAAIPADAEIVAGYVDGNWPTFDALVKAFPNARHVSITVGATGGAGAMVADCETGDFSPDGAAHWAKGEIDAGRRPCVYYSRSNAAAVSAALSRAGVPTNAVDYWVADWTGAAHVVPGSVATQWASPATGSGGNFDISETVGTWPPPVHVPSPPVPEPVPPIPAPTPGPAPSPTGGFMPPTIKQGDLSGAVRNAQRLLNVHGAGLATDGAFGPATDKAVRNFQTVLHLGVDGIVGPATWTALDTFG